MVVMGMLLILGSMGLISSVLAEWEQASGIRQLDKLVLNVNANLPNAEGLQLQDAEQLAKKWSPQGIAYSAEAQEKVLAGSSSVLADVFGVSGNYNQFASFSMKTGSSITQQAVDEHSRIAVLSEWTADKLFRSASVIGKEIELYGAKFTIIGVYDDRDSLLMQLGDDGIADVWIPVTAMLDLRQESRIGHIELAVKPEGTIRAETEAANALRAIGINPAEFRINNEVLAHRQLAQLPNLLLFVCGIAAIYLLGRLMLRLWREQIKSIQHQHLTEDLPDIVKHQRYKLLTCLFASAVMAACAAWIWQHIRFRFYISPEWLPEQLIEVSFYLEKLKSVWQQQAAQAGYIPSAQERLTTAARELSWKGLFLGTFGLLIVWLGLRWWTVRKVPVTVQLQNIFLFLPIIAVITFAAIRLTGLEYRLDLMEYAVVGVFMVSFILYFHKPKGVTYLDVQNER